MYAVEACPVLVRDKQSLEFTISRSLMKLFRTGSADVRTTKFLEKFTSSENLICSLFCQAGRRKHTKKFLKIW